jgi:hypothetical protein
MCSLVIILYELQLAFGNALVFTCDKRVVVPVPTVEHKLHGPVYVCLLGWLGWLEVFLFFVFFFLFFFFFFVVVYILFFFLF